MLNHLCQLPAKKMKKGVLLALLCSTLPLTMAPSVAQTPPLSAAKRLERDTLAELIRSKPHILKGTAISDKDSELIANAADYNCRFLIPTLCELMGIVVENPEPSTAGPPRYYYYPASKALSSYGKAALPYLLDVFASPQGEGRQKEQARKNNASDLILDISLGGSPAQNSMILRKQAEQYRTYAIRTQFLAKRAENSVVPTLATSTPDARSPEDRLRRACEILITLEDAQKKPLPAAEEAALVKEMGTLQQDFSASTLVEYLAKPVAGIDTAQIKGALLALGEPAIPELIRFLRCDDYSPESRLDALPLLVALCKSPQAAQERLQQTAKAYEEGAKFFEDKAIAIAQ